jgi:hypothetical protein
MIFLQRSFSFQGFASRGVLADVSLVVEGKTVQAHKAVFRIRIHVFFGHPDPLVRGMDPDPALDPNPSIIMQK